jgi:hypothetical protein
MIQLNEYLINRQTKEKVNIVDEILDLAYNITKRDQRYAKECYIIEYLRQDMTKIYGDDITITYKSRSRKFEERYCLDYFFYYNDKIDRNMLRMSCISLQDPRNIIEIPFNKDFTCYFNDIKFIYIMKDCLQKYWDKNYA